MVAIAGAVDAERRAGLDGKDGGAKETPRAGTNTCKPHDHHLGDFDT
jgi:hypothetical protein